MSISNQVNNNLRQGALIDELGPQEQNKDNDGIRVGAVNIINRIPQAAASPRNIEQRQPVIVADLIDDRIAELGERRPSLVNVEVEPRAEGEGDLPPNAAQAIDLIGFLANLDF